MQQRTQKEYETFPDDALFDRHGQAIFAYVHMHTALREDAEDITLEVFTIALENDNLAAITEQEQLAWLRRVAHNKLVDGYRSFTRHPITRLGSLSEMLQGNEEELPEAIILRRETYAQLHQSIRQLPLLQQQILQLRYGNGLRFAEIAVLLNKREDAVRKLLSRTVATLRTIYKQQAQEGEQ